MRLLVAASILAFAGTGCAEEAVPPRVAFSPRSPDVRCVAAPAPPLAPSEEEPEPEPGLEPEPELYVEAQPALRPRLSQTVVLGDEGAYVDPSRRVAPTDLVVYDSPPFEDPFFEGYPRPIVVYRPYHHHGHPPVYGRPFGHAWGNSWHGGAYTTGGSGGNGGSVMMGGGHVGGSHFGGGVHGGSGGAHGGSFGGGSHGGGSHGGGSHGGGSHGGGSHGGHGGHR